MKKTLYRLMIELTNYEWLSKALKKFAQSPVSKRIIPSFSKTYQINLDEIDHSLHEYDSLHHFFTRKLKEGARPISSGEDTIVSPVDGKIESFGTITEEQVFTAKQKPYSLVDLFGSEEDARRYIGGTFMIIYLSPSNYHRIHSPYFGVVKKTKALGTKSYPVNTASLKYGKEPLSKNYRVITQFDCNGKEFSVVKVGAMFVNCIELTFTDEKVQKGDELGYFSFGSTVILFFEKDFIHVSKDIKEGQPIRMGERIGTAQ